MSYALLVKNNLIEGLFSARTVEKQIERFERSHEQCEAYYTNSKIVYIIQYKSNRKFDSLIDSQQMSSRSFLRELINDIDSGANDVILVVCSANVLPYDEIEGKSDVIEYLANRLQRLLVRY